VEKHEALGSAVAQIERQFGKGAIMRMGDQPIAETAAIPTGSLALDIGLGIGGLPKGRIVEIYGPESSGKTTMVYHLIAQAQKRGGGRRRLSLDYESGESRYRLEPADSETPDKIYQRQWVLTLLDQVLSCLREEFERAGKLREFDCLKPFITARTDQLTSTDAAAELGISPGAVKSAAHRLRVRYRELLRAHIARTVDGRAEVEAEIQQLFVALGR